MRKTKEFVILIVIFVALVVSTELVFGYWPKNDTGGQPKVKDLRDYLLQPPASVYAEYGWNEDTFRLYNMVANKELGQGHEPRIKALEDNVAKLLIEVNDLKKQVSEATVLPTLDDGEAVDTNVPQKSTEMEGGSKLRGGDPGIDTLPDLGKRTENRYPEYESRCPGPTDSNEVAE